MSIIESYKRYNDEHIEYHPSDASICDTCDSVVKKLHEYLDSNMHIIYASKMFEYQASLNLSINKQDFVILRYIIDVASDDIDEMSYEINFKVSIYQLAMMLQHRHRFSNIINLDVNNSLHHKTFIFTKKLGPEYYGLDAIGIKLRHIVLGIVSSL